MYIIKSIYTLEHVNAWYFTSAFRSHAKFYFELCFFINIHVEEYTESRWMGIENNFCI